jgi:hypothetical protein
MGPVGFEGASGTRAGAGPQARGAEPGRAERANSARIRPAGRLVIEAMVSIRSHRRVIPYGVLGIGSALARWAWWRLVGVVPGGGWVCRDAAGT